ncbi:hypothetical protein GCM10022231_36430 [Gordonia caeni]|uniref:Carrier domain-containing protein n=2 Tax=Gordonia caeni TaxID=1007097 RepID=A0ABP7PUP3_9ACTN
MFVGTVVLRTPVDPGQPFRDLLAAVRAVDLDAFAHADLPFDRLVDLLRPRRSAAYHPLFQVGFSYQNLPPADFALDHLDVQVLEPDLGVAKSDLHLTLVEGPAGEGMAVHWDYDRDLFDHSTVQRWHGLWTDLLTAALDDPDSPVGDLAPARSSGVLEGPAGGRTATTLTALLETSFTDYAERPALCPDDGRPTTYAETAERVQRLAGRLRAAGVGPEVRVAVAIDRSLHLVDAVLAVLVAGGAYVPLDPAAPAQRTALVLESAAPALLLVAGDVPAGVGEPGIPVLDVTADAAVDLPAAWPRPLPGHTAYVIYTSGSTGAPKGVAVSHGAVAAQLGFKRTAFPLGEGDTTVLKTPLTFDLSVWELFWPLVTGARLVLAAPGRHVDPRYLAELMRRRDVTAAHFVPSLLDAQLDAAADAELDPHTLRQVLCIGETLPPATAARAARELSARVYNLYGPTEAAVGITVHECTAEETTVPIGVPVDDSAALVLDARLHRVPVGVVGELYLRGVQLATAYDGRPELTAERFVADPDGSGGRIYRTGDLARIRPDGLLEFLGRNDFQIKIRGQRIELGEIEAALAVDPRVGAAAVTARGDNLVAFLVPAAGAATGRDWEVREILDALRDRLPGYMVPVSGVVLAEMPRGIHGKVDRAALPAAPDVTHRHIAPRTLTEQALGEVLGDLLGTAEPVGMADDFFSLGGNSLLAARLAARIGDRLGVDLGVREVFEAPRVEDLARRIDAAHDLRRPRLERAERPAVIPLSRAQQRMWLLDRIEPGSALYNLPVALRVEGPLEHSALRDAVRYLLDRHEVLRTSYPDHGGVPRQQIHPTDEALGLIDLEFGATGPVSAIAGRGFDLETRIPLRVAVIDQEPGVHLVVIVVHHVAADGWSARALVRDLLDGYAGRSAAEPLPVQYADYALWQTRLLEGLDHQHDFWRRTLADLPGPIPLPTDRTRPAQPGRAGGTVEFVLDADLMAGLGRLARSRNASLFHVVHAGLAVLLSRLSGSGDIVVGTPVAGRGSHLLDDVVGMFTETVVLRTRIDDDAETGALVARTAAADLAAQANSEYPFERIADEFEADRGGAHHPIFQVMLAFGDPLPGRLELGPISATPMTLDVPLARFDLHLTLDVPLDAAAPDGPVRARWTYATELFDRATVEGFAARLQSVLRAVAERPQSLVHHLPVLTGPETEAVTGAWSHAEIATDPPASTVADLVAAGQAAEVADQNSVLGGGAFAARVARTARALVAAGVGPETTVAVAVPRSIDMLVALHAVVVAGGAYVPVDPDQPAARTAAMFATVDPVAVIAAESTWHAVPETFTGHRFDASDPHTDRAASPVTDADRWVPLRPAHPVYILFTSGSTGEPKGVSVSHAAVVNRLDWMARRTPIDAADTVLQKTPTTFDVSVWELFWPFVAGSRLVLAAPGAHRDPHELAAVIAAERVSVIHFVPAMLDAFLASGISDDRLTSLRLVFTSGEALAAAPAAELLRRTGAQLHNLYGPTEAAVDVTGVQVRAGDLAERPVSIGRPLPGTATYVLDHRLRPVPAGVTGELYLGGVQLARGYHGRPDLTGARFVASPWGTAERLYRTGDLVRWVRPHSDALPVLEYLGRSDFQVKIRGQRVELGEIDAVLTAHPRVQTAVTVQHHDPRSGAQLVAHVVRGVSDVPGEPTAAQLRTHVAAHLPDHMVPAHIVLAERLPVTSSGKVDRAALPAPVLQSPRSGRSAETASELLVLDVIRELLGEHVGIDDDFFAAGGNSLIATRVVAAVAERTGVRVPVRAVFDGRTGASIAAAVEAGGATTERSVPESIAAAPRPAEIPLGPGQLPMWLHNRRHPGSAAYLIVAPVRLPGTVDAGALAAALGDLLERHEILRTVYPEGTGGPHQHIHAVADCAPETLIAAVPPDPDADAEQAALAAALAWPIDLITDLPLRVVVHPDGDDTVLVLAVHHIAADGWSLRILARDLTAAYRARIAGQRPDWTALPMQYADHALSRAGRSGEHRDYWLAQLAGAPLEPGFRSAPAPDADSAAPSAGVQHTRLEAVEVDAVRELATRTRSTVLAVLHAALAVTLRRSGSGPDVVIGTPTSGRLDPQIADLVGLFVAVAPLRSTVRRDTAFATLVEQSRDTVLEAMEHEDAEAGEIAGHPFIHVSLALDEQQAPPGALRMDVPVARFDLEFSGVGTADGGLDLAVVHRADVYRADTAARLLDRLTHLLRQAIAAPHRPIGDLDALLPAEQAATASLAPPHTAGPRTAAAPQLLGDLLQTPGWRLAGMSEEVMNARTNRLSRLLIARGVGPESVVALCLSRSAWSVIAMRAVAATGAAFVPIDPAYPAERLAFMATDSGASIVVTVSADRDCLDALPGGLAAGALVVDDPRLQADAEALPNEPIGAGELRGPRHADQTAYLIYTSGSTGRPKAVAVTHRGLASFVAEQRRYGAGAHSRVLHFASPSFDAAILELLLAADAGATTVIAPTDVYGADDLVALLRAEAVTHAFLTPAVLDTLEVAGGQDPLPQLQTLVVGGDACAPATARRWTDRGKALFNAYGPTECTVMATVAGPIAAPAGESLPIGGPIAGAGVRVLDTDLTPCPPGVPGELYVTGPGLARGYAGRAGLTAGAFIADPYGEPGVRCYRTGDLVRAVPDGTGGLHLEHLGRVDHQLKIRGHRIETGEVEAALRRFDTVTAAAVAGRPGPDGRTALVAYVTSSPAGLDRSALREHLRSLLPPYAVPAAIVALDVFPLTVSGKVDLRALPDPDFDGLTHVAPMGAAEELVTAIFAEVLDQRRLGVTDDFFLAGGNSLTAAQAIARIREAAGREVSVRTLFERPTARELAAALEESAIGAGPRIGELPRPERVPLSPAQQRMWFLNRLDPDALTENIPVVLRLRGRLDTDAFAAALGDLVARHEVLRTVYPDGPDGPHQVVLPPAQARIEPTRQQGRPAADSDVVQRVVRRGFDVTARPPVRATLWSDQDSGEHLFVLVVHHICADGLSMATLAGDLAQAYRDRLAGRTPDTSGPAVQYADYAIWQRAFLETAARGQLEHWRERLLDAPPVIDLPTDRPRPVRPSRAGDRIDFAVDARLTARMTDFARSRGATPFMVAHNAFAILLGRLGANRDVVIGTPVAGRGDAHLDQMVGMFVNMLALRTVIDPSATGEQALATAREAALHAFANAAVPFDRVVEVLDRPRTSAHHPVFQVALSFQNIGPLELSLPGVDVEAIDGEQGVAEFDLHLTLADGAPDGGLIGRLDYATDLFDAATAAAVAEQYVRVLTGLLAAPVAAVGDLGLLTPDQAVHLQRSAPLPRRRGGGLADAFHRQARRTPDAPAVDAGGCTLTYRQLSQRVLALAAELAQRGAGPEDRVAITAPRGLEQLVAMYAVATVGAAYVPIDPSAPQRADDIRRTAQPLLELGAGDVDLDRLSAAAPVDAASFVGRAGPAHPAYVMFTSGSTGRPKGVSVPNEAVGQQLRWMQDHYRLTADDAVLVRTAAGFDLSVWEYWWALSCGARIVLAEEGLERDGAGLRRAFTDHAITVVPTVPSALAMVLDAGPLPESVRSVLCIGEELPAELVRRLADGGSPAVVHNLYGPTECAVSATAHRADGPIGERIPIGGAQPAVTARVLDERLHPVPDGVAGELYLGGVQLARGYHADPARTAAAFVADPFDPGARMYRTGDLVRRGRDGLLIYLGRTDHQLKVHGFRIEPGEIEAVLRRCTGVADAVVTAAGTGAAGERLIAFVTGDDVQPQTVGRELGHRLPGYLRPEIVAVDALPYNANGKVDRARLPQPPVARRRYVPPRTELEKRVTAIVAEVTGTSGVGVADDFFTLGGTSLSATRVAARLEAELGHPVPVRLLFDSVDLGDFAAQIEALPPAAVAASPLVRREDDSPAPMAPAQMRIWRAVRAGTGADWNVPVAMRLTGEFDVDVLAAALLDVIDHHRALRTRYRDAGAGPELVVTPTGELAAPLRADLGPTAVTEDALAATISEIAWAELDLENRAPIRARLLRLDPRSHVLVVVVHHLSADGQSMGTLIRDVLAAFAARCHGVEPVLAEPAVRFTDYAHWRTEVLGAPGARTAEFGRQLGYWTGAVGRPQSAAPEGTAPDDAWDSAGDTVEFELDASLHGALEAYATVESVGLFAVLQAAFATVLAELTGEPEVRIGTANANRAHAALDGVVGNFAEDIPMRFTVTEEQPFTGLVRDAQRQLLGGLAHPDVSVSDLIDALDLPDTAGGPAGAPFFPATLILQQAEAGETGGGEVDLGGVRVRREPVANTVAKHLYEIALLERRDRGRAAGVAGTLIFPVRRVSRERAEGLVEHLVALLTAVTSGRVSELTARVR